VKCDSYIATVHRPAGVQAVRRLIEGAPEEPERPKRITVVVELVDVDAWAWNPHNVAEPFTGPGSVVYERLPDGRVFAVFVPVDPALEQLVDKLVEVTRGE
jgi:hypothetical protein